MTDNIENTPDQLERPKDYESESEAGSGETTAPEPRLTPVRSKNANSDSNHAPLTAEDDVIDTIVEKMAESLNSTDSADEAKKKQNTVDSDESEISRPVIAEVDEPDIEKEHDLSNSLPLNTAPGDGGREEDATFRTRGFAQLDASSDSGASTSSIGIRKVDADEEKSDSSCETQDIPPIRKPWKNTMEDHAIPRRHGVGSSSLPAENQQALSETPEKVRDPQKDVSPTLVDADAVASSKTVPLSSTPIPEPTTSVDAVAAPPPFQVNTSAPARGGRLIDSVSKRFAGRTLRLPAMERPKAKPDLPKTPAELLGKILQGRFLVKEILAESEYSVLYLAVERESMSKVVMKTCADLSPRALSRFKVQAQTLLELRHPSIVRPLEVFESEAGQPFLVMEHLICISLLDLLASSGSISSAEEMVNMLSKVCLALSHAHSVGMHHGFLHPSNILLTEEGDELDVKVTDFGFSRYFRKSEIASIASSAGIDLRAEPDFSGDIYQLGLLICLCTMGEPPFEYSFEEAITLEPPLSKEKRERLDNPLLKGGFALGELLAEVMSNGADVPRISDAQVVRERLWRWLDGVRQGSTSQTLPVIEFEDGDQRFERSEARTKSAAAKEAVRSTVRQMISLKRRQLDEEETLAAQFTRIAAVGSRKSPLHTAAIIVSTFIFFVSAAYLAFVKRDALYDFWMESSYELSQRMFPGASDTEELLGDETATLDPTDNPDKSKVKNNGSAGAVGQITRPDASASARARARRSRRPRPKIPSGKEFYQNSWRFSTTNNNPFDFGPGQNSGIGNRRIIDYAAFPGDLKSREWKPKREK